MVMRMVAAAAVLVSAAVHLIMWFNGVRDQSVGPAFLLNAAGGVVIAALLLLWNHWVPPLLAIGFGVSTLGAFVIWSGKNPLINTAHVVNGALVLATSLVLSLRSFRAAFERAAVAVTRPAPSIGRHELQGARS